MSQDDSAPQPLGRRLAELRFLTPSLFGFAFARAYYDVLAQLCADVHPGLPWLGQDLVVLGMLPAFLVCVAAARRVLPLSSQRGASPAAAALMLAGAALVCLAGASPLPRVPLLGAGALLGGLGTGLSILLWAELQSCWNSFQIMLYVSGAFFLGPLLGWLVLGMAQPQRAVAMLALPLLSWACLCTGLNHVPVSEHPCGFSGGLRFPWKLVVALGVYEFVLGVRQASTTFTGEVFAASVAACSGALFLMVYFFSHRFDFTYVYRTPFALMSCGLLTTLVSISSESLAADALVSVGYALMFIVLTVLLCDMAHRHHVSAALLCGIQELVMLTSLAGHGTGAALASGMLPAGPNSPAVLVGLATLVIVASMALLPEREYARWGSALFGMGSLSQTHDARNALLARCEELGETHALSPREREVLQLLAQGAGSVEIERALCIAEGTLKSHTRRIYRKLGIHSREELAELVEKQAESRVSAAPLPPQGR